MPLLLLCVFFSGCGPKFTYTADTVPKAIEDIAKKEYNIDTQVRVAGKTVGAVVYVDSLMDATGQVPKELHEKMGKVVQVVTRVALSTDLEIDFCTVIMRDASGRELIITRALDDIKRANAEAIGVEESLNRTIFGQSKYEVVPDVKPEETPFVLQDIRLENFLAEQIVQRIRFQFSRDMQDATGHPFLLADGNFSTVDGKRAFRFSLLALKSEEPRSTILRIFKIVNDVLMGYKFTGFDELEIQDYLNRQKLVISKDTLVDYWDKKIKDAELLDRFLVESSSIQEAFKLFGFNAPQDPV